MIMQRAPFVGVTVSKFEGIMPSTIIRGLRLLGFEFVEFNNSIFPEMDKVASNLGPMKTAFHLPLITDDGWDFSCAAYQNEIDHAIHLLNSFRKKLNIQHVVCHPPENNGVENSESSLDLLISNLKKLHLPIHLENIPSVSPEEFQSIYARIKNQVGENLHGICFDAPHFFIKGFDPIKQYKSLNDNIRSIHLSDCMDDRDEHIPFNSGGSLPVIDFLKSVQESKFSGFITLEIRPNSLDDLDSYMNSYLTTLQHVNVKKYKSSKVRMFFLRPFINRIAA